MLDNKRVVVADVTFSSSYATGGDTFALSSIGLHDLGSAWCEAGAFSASASGGYTPTGSGLQVVLAGTTSAPKLKVFNGSSTEVSAATDLSAKTAVRIEFRGN